MLIRNVVDANSKRFKLSRQGIHSALTKKSNKNWKEFGSSCCNTKLMMTDGNDIGRISQSLLQIRLCQHQLEPQVLGRMSGPTADWALGQIVMMLTTSLICQTQSITNYRKRFWSFPWKKQFSIFLLFLKNLFENNY